MLFESSSREEAPIVSAVAEIRENALTLRKASEMYDVLTSYNAFLIGGQVGLI